MYQKMFSLTKSESDMSFILNFGMIALFVIAAVVAGIACVFERNSEKRMIPLIAKLREDFVNGKIDQSHPAVRTLIDGAAFANWRVCWAASFVTSMVISFVASKILTCSNDPMKVFALFWLCFFPLYFTLGCVMSYVTSHRFAGAPPFYTTRPDNTQIG